jgi:hypothetical protein
MEGLINNAPIPWKTIEIDQVWSSVRDAYSDLLDDDGAPAKGIEPPKLEEIAGGSEWLPSTTLTALNQALLGCCKDIAQRIEHGTLKPADEWRKTVRRRFFVSSNSGSADEWNQALDPASLFPKAGPRTQAELRKWLENLLSEESKRRDQALDGLSTKVELLIEAAQLEVINEDLPNVIFDAVSEQAEWNNFKVVEAKKDAKPKRTASATAAGAQSGDVAITDAEAVSPFIFQRASGQFDPFFATLGAVEHMRRAMLAFDEDARAPLSPKETRLGSFFVRNYTVAKERLQRDVPQPVLLELLATGLLVVRNCILNLPYMEKIRRHPLYIFGADLPLRAFYAAAVLMRRAPQWIIATYITVALLSMLSLAIAFFWWDSLMSGTKGVRTFFVLVALPAVLLVAEALIIIFTSRLFQKRDQSETG